MALSVNDAHFKDSGGDPYLTDSHLEQVVKMSSAFLEYMKFTRNMDGGDWALHLKNRNDFLGTGSADEE